MAQNLWSPRSEDWATVNFSDTSMFDVDVLDVFGQHWDDMPGEH